MWNNIKQLIINFILFLVSKTLSTLLSIIGFLWAILRCGSISNLSTYFFEYAVMIDRTGNVSMSHMFNDILIKKTGYKFGQKDETISGVLGKNYDANTLTFLGKGISNILNSIQPNHVDISEVKNPQDI